MRIEQLLTWRTVGWVLIGGAVLWIWRPFGPSTEEWDRRIDVMCAERWAPGKAYKVYVTEKIVPPKSYFTPNMAEFIGPKSDNELSRNNLPDNPLIWRMTELEVLNEKNPRVSVYATQHVRQSDRKVVGEAYAIIRAGTSSWIELGYLNRKTCPSDLSGYYMNMELYDGLVPSHFGVKATTEGSAK